MISASEVIRGVQLVYNASNGVQVTVLETNAARISSEAPLTRCYRRNSCVDLLAMRTLARNIYHSLYRFSIRTRCFCADLVGHGSDLPPALFRFRISESMSEKRYVDIGQGCARIIEARCSENSAGLHTGTQVLDFGCGCGRTIR